MTGEVLIARAKHHVTYPARILLSAAMNPCRCGGGPGAGACRRGPCCAIDYQGRLSGPLLDRIDIQLDVPPVRAADLTLPPPVEGAEAAARVTRAREARAARGARLSPHFEGFPHHRDLDGADAVRRIHVAEALSLKRRWASADQAGFAKVS